jgi:hypothetical protein
MTSRTTGTGEFKGNGAAPPSDALDIVELFVKSEHGDPLTAMTMHRIPVGKPRDFFRTVPASSYRERAEVYVHKPENTVDETTYIIGPALRGLIEEACPCILITIVDRVGNPRIWPIKTTKDGGKEQPAWSTALQIARTGLTHWVRLAWVNTSTGYKERRAEPGYAPDPDLSQLPPFCELVKAAFGSDGVIRDKNHPVYRSLFGLATPQLVDDADPLL